MLKLIPLLTGRPMEAYANMEQEMAKDYKVVKHALLHRFDINKETYHQRFHSVRMKDRDRRLCRIGGQTY